MRYISQPRSPRCRFNLWYLVLCSSTVYPPNRPSVHTILHTNHIHFTPRSLYHFSTGSLPIARACQPPRTSRPHANFHDPHPHLTFMMLLPSQLSVCATAAALFLAAGAFANPGMHPHPVSHGQAGLVTRSEAATNPLNPLNIVLRPLEMMMTNGDRMRRGLPLKKPQFRRAGM